MKTKTPYLLSFILLGILLISSLPGKSFAQNDGVPAQDDVPIIFVNFDSISVTIISDRKVKGILMVDFQLALKETEDRDLVEKLEPRVRSELIQALTRFAAARVDVKRIVNVDLLASRMQEAVDKVLGEGLAQVLIEVASTQAR